MNVAAVTDGDIRAGLTAIRDELADRLSTVQRADAVAPIAKTLIDVIVKLNDLPDDAKGSVTDDLGKRRAERRAAAGSEKAAGL